MAGYWEKSEMVGEIARQRGKNEREWKKEDKSRDARESGRLSIFVYFLDICMSVSLDRVQRNGLGRFLRASGHAAINCVEINRTIIDGAIKIDWAVSE